ncbi:MAG: alpha/beta fold hydrolase [Burkholderiaceae bacterium]
MKSNIDATVPDKPVWPAPRRLRVDALHRIAWRDLGATDGECWLLLHGGPGGACQPGMLQPFDLARQRVIAADQRGAGASRPRGRIQNNHTAALVADLERLREHLGVQRWSLLAGSWGTVVALTYAAQHPHRVERLVLRGAFRVTDHEIGALLLPSVRRRKSRIEGPPATRAIWPVPAGRPLPVALAGLARLLRNVTPSVAALRTVRGWALREMRDAATGMRRTLLDAHGWQAAAARRQWAALRRQQRRAAARLLSPAMDRADRSLWTRYRVQAHYLQHHGFVRPASLDHAVRVIARHRIPVDWVHGRFDAICPPANSVHWASLGRREGGPARLHLLRCGHLAGEPAMRAGLRRCVQAPDRYP